MLPCAGMSCTTRSTSIFYYFVGLSPASGDDVILVSTSCVPVDISFIAFHAISFNGDIWYWWYYWILWPSVTWHCLEVELLPHSIVSTLMYLVIPTIGTSWGILCQCSFLSTGWFSKEVFQPLVEVLVARSCLWRHYQCHWIRRVCVLLFVGCVLVVFSRFCGARDIVLFNGSSSWNFIDYLRYSAALIRVTCACTFFSVSSDSLAAVVSVDYRYVYDVVCTRDMSERYKSTRVPCYNGTGTCKSRYLLLVFATTVKYCAYYNFDGRDFFDCDTVTCSARLNDV